MGGRGPYRHSQTIHCNLPAGKVVEMNLYCSGRVHVHRATATRTSAVVSKNFPIPSYNGEAC
jgi:hypothetical protein